MPDRTVLTASSPKYHEPTSCQKGVKVTPEYVEKVPNQWAWKFEDKTNMWPDRR